MGREWFARDYATRDGTTPQLPSTAASTDDVLQAVARLMGCSKRAARQHYARLVAFGILKPVRDQVTICMEEWWRVGEFNRLHYGDEYDRFQLGQRGRITEDELLAAARLWARLPDGTEFDILDRSPDDMQPKEIHSRILSLQLLLHGLGVWQNERGYHEPPPSAPQVLSRADLHAAAKKEIRARTAEGRIVNRMVVRNQRGLDDVLELGIACGIFIPQPRGRSQKTVPFYRIQWERLYDAMTLGSLTRIICCPCVEKWAEEDRPDKNTLGHFLDCVRARHQPHHGGKPIPEEIWDGKSSLTDILRTDK